MTSAGDAVAFPCNGCGKCCRLVDRSVETAWLDRGDGTCRSFDETTLRCTIYETRPLVCRIHDYHTRYLADQVSWSDFVRINIDICARL